MRRLALLFFIIAPQAWGQYPHCQGGSGSNGVTERELGVDTTTDPVTKQLTIIRTVQQTTSRPGVTSQYRICIRKEEVRPLAAKPPQPLPKVTTIAPPIEAPHLARVDTVRTFRTDTVTVVREIHEGRSCWKSFSICTILPLLAAGAVGYYLWDKDRDRAKACSSATAIAGPGGATALAGCPPNDAEAHALRRGISLTIW